MMLLTTSQPASTPRRHISTIGTPYTISLKIVMTGVRGRTLHIGWSQAGNMDIGINSSESISIGVKSVQMMTLAARNDPAMLPIALPTARKVIMPNIVIPTKAAHEPRTWILKKILPTTNRASIPTTIKIGNYPLTTR